MAKSPRIEIIPTSSEDVCFESSADVNHIELPLFNSRDLGSDDFSRWEVELRRRKRICQPLDVVLAKEYEQVQIICEAWLSVENGCDTAAYDVTQTQPVQRAQEYQREFSFGHG